MTGGGPAPPDTPGFTRFLDTWNRFQEQSTPAHHRVIAEWLETAMTEGERTLLLMAFRGAGKSTVVGLFAAWLLLRDPNRRVMVVGADHKLARRMVRNVMRIIELHPDLEGLKPAGRVTWSSEEFTVARTRELREPSMIARSVVGNITGSRADVVICDDVEVPRTCDTAPKRGDLRERLSEIDYVLVPGGLQLYIGTPHSYYSIYADQPRPEAGETEPFLDGFRRMVLPVWDANRVPAWPERYDTAHIERIRRRHGPAKFATQMLLQPVSVSAGRLDPDRLRHYDGEPEYREVHGRPLLTLDGTRLVSASCWWDPAFARPSEDGRTGDSSVVAAVFGGEDGRLFLHRVVYLTVDPDDGATEAAQQCRQVVELVRALHLPGVHVETNGLGTFLPGLLRQSFGKARLAAAVIGVSSRTPKDKRIVEAFDAPLADGRIHAHRSVWDTPFVREMREWRPGGRARVHDDGLDAVAGAIACEPLRFDRPPPATGPRAGWQPGPVVAEHDWPL